MSIAIKVGPPALTINQGNTFMVTDLRGEIHPYQEQGVFAQDTRFPHYRLLPWGPSGLRFDFRHVVAQKVGRGFVYRALTFVVSLVLTSLIIAKLVSRAVRAEFDAL